MNKTRAKISVQFLWVSLKWFVAKIFLKMITTLTSLTFQVRIIILTIIYYFTSIYSHKWSELNIFVDNIDGNDAKHESSSTRIVYNPEIGVKGIILYIYWLDVVRTSCYKMLIFTLSHKVIDQLKICIVSQVLKLLRGFVRSTSSWTSLHEYPRCIYF